MQARTRDFKTVLLPAAEAVIGGYYTATLTGTTGSTFTGTVAPAAERRGRGRAGGRAGAIAGRVASGRGELSAPCSTLSKKRCATPTRPCDRHGPVVLRVLALPGRCLTMAMNQAHPRYVVGDPLGAAVTRVALDRRQLRAELSVIVLDAMRRVAADAATIPRRWTVVHHTDVSVVTIERFIIEQEKRPRAAGDRRALRDPLRSRPRRQDDRQQGPQRRAGRHPGRDRGHQRAGRDPAEARRPRQRRSSIKALDHGGRLCAMASEEEPDIIPIPEGFRTGKYCLLFDPLDGSSNIDVNVPVGTIFSVLKKVTPRTARAS